MVIQIKVPHDAVTSAFLPLENGDRLTRVEFERRYAAMPQVKHAELVEGVVYMPSPVRFQTHSQPHAMIMACLGVYCAATPGVGLGDNATVRLDRDNEVQPDALLRIESMNGGHSMISPDDFVEGPPELIVEIASSSAAYDLHDKFRVYRRNGVQEYLVWQIYEQRMDWFYLSEEDYQALLPTSEGRLCSVVFPGLWLQVDALLRGDLADALRMLQQGLGTDAHRAFVVRLQAVAPQP